MKTTTLDALIPREDFEIISTQGSIGNTRNKSTLSIEDLKHDSFFFTALRKPIFQRETNEWDPNKVCGMIESFINGELVPSIILWRNKGGYIFVIDGAHRLSSLSAWINDDYGDSSISLNYYGNFISTEQKNVAEKTRIIVNGRIGSFKEIIEISKNINITSDKLKQEIAKNLGALALQVQWVEGDATKAEDSFLKINQSATKINDAELELIKNREMAFAIASRAIVRAGKGYQYWSNFNPTSQNRIINISQKIHKIMFGEGTYNADDINSFTIGGVQSSSFTLDVVTQTVKISNDITKTVNNNGDVIKDESMKGNDKNVIGCLDNTLKLLQYINSKEQFSLGIHPFIYFYSDIGKHKIGSYYGFLLFIKELINKNQLSMFTSVRGTFEQVIYHYSFLVQQIIRRNRQSKRAYTPIKDYFMALMKIIYENPGYSIEEIISQIRLLPDFKFLQTEIVDNDLASVKGNFSRGKKQQIKLSTFVSSLPKCPICGGYMDNKSISVDHIQRKSDGGTNSLLNGQVTHLYCNTTFKN